MSEIIPIQNAVLERIPVAAKNNPISLTDVISLTGALAGKPQALALTGVNLLSKSAKFGNLLQGADKLVPKTIGQLLVK